MKGMKRNNKKTAEKPIQKINNTHNTTQHNTTEQHPHKYVLPTYNINNILP